ncbi:MAG: hypothetical protein DMG97_03155 [Acidobacteria bacterium]|nr:MAG: hypothetical protein DMG97_03155 [Acidobacteriota bacterium]
MREKDLKQPFNVSALNSETEERPMKCDKYMGGCASGNEGHDEPMMAEREDPQGSKTFLGKGDDLSRKGTETNEYERAIEEAR